MIATPPLDDATQGPADLSRPYDAIVIGSGLGGASLARRLGERGLKTLVIEQGDYLRPTRAPSDPVGLFIANVHGDREKPIHYVGGQTKFYGAALYRFRQSDFLAVEHEAGVSPGWPISYADIEPYYQQAEEMFRVHGSIDGDPSEPPRAKPFPHPPLEHQSPVSDMVAKLRRAGVSVSAIPRGVDYGPNGKCVLCATCDAHYCSIDAKMDAEIAAIRPALATGNVHISTRTRSLRILTNASGSAVEGVLVERDGVTATIRAEHVAVCAGIPGSALLLRSSKTDAHPHGLGNASGALGRYLGGHSTGMIFPILGLGKVPPVHTKTFAINEYYDHAPGWSYPTGVIQVAGQMPFWNEASGVMRHIAYALGTRSIMCFYMTEALPTADTGLYFRADEIAERRSPVQNLATFRHLRKLAVQAFWRAGFPAVARKREPYVWHEVGTTRFGDDPGTSVADPDCQVHSVKGLYVVDASVLPSAGAVNTGLTIAALALRAGDHIAGLRYATSSPALAA